MHTGGLSGLNELLYGCPAHLPAALANSGHGLASKCQHLLLSKDMLS